MPFIDLKTREVTYSDDEMNICGLCKKPFEHYTKNRKNRVTGMTEVQFITCHPQCTKVNMRMEKLNARIVKAKRNLHDLRTAQLNLEFEMFLAGQKTIQDDTDEVFVVLQKKGILSSENEEI